MTFDHDFGYSILLLSSLLQKTEKAKIVIKSHAFLLDQENLFSKLLQIRGVSRMHSLGFESMKKVLIFDVIKEILH